MKAMKIRTIDQLCKIAPGGFKNFLKQKEAYLQASEDQRKDRIRALRRAARQLSWAA